jgi:hypothetical protein
MDKLVHFVAVAIGFIVFSLTNNIIIGALAGVAAEAVILPVFFALRKKPQAGIALSPKEATTQPATQKQSSLNILFYVFCAIYVACTVFVIFVSIDESAMPMVLASSLTILGCLLLFFKKYFGILVSIAGTAIVIISSFVIDIYHPYIDGHFDIYALAILLMLTVVPSLILLVITLIITKGRLFTP